MRFNIYKFNRDSIRNEIHRWIYRTTLFYAVGKNDVEIVKLLLTNDKINVNVLNIHTKFYQYHSISRHFMWFQVIFFNYIFNKTIQWNLKIYLHNKIFGNILIKKQYYTWQQKITTRKLSNCY